MNIPGNMPSWAVLLSDAVTAAETLLGCDLVRVHRRRIRRARIVETEAYPPGDPASHCFRGPTKRNAVMYGRPGLAYIYRIHRVVCLNVVTGPEGRGEAVLIRAVEPREGIELMERARNRNSVGRARPFGFDLTNGPGKLCQALDLSLTMDGIDLLQRTSGLSLEYVSPDATAHIRRSSRIGISKAREAPLRFYIDANPWVSPTRPAG